MNEMMARTTKEFAKEFSLASLSFSILCTPKSPSILNDVDEFYIVLFKK